MFTQDLTNCPMGGGGGEQKLIIAQTNEDDLQDCTVTEMLQ